MFGFGKKSEKDRLQQQYADMMKKARDIQRSGDLRSYAVIMEEAEALAKKIETLP